MKIRESGMPPPEEWESFFEPESILQKLGLTSGCNDVVEFGCGYGTFTIPAARVVGGTVHTVEMDSDMLTTARNRASDSGLANIEFVDRDFISDGTGLPDESMDYAMVFNIAHHEQPIGLLREAWRNLKDDGMLGIIHWNHDPETPRGPPMAIRPQPKQCLLWALQAGFSPRSDIIALPPYHYGLVLSRERNLGKR